MVLIVLEKVPASLRGELSRWLMEIHTGVFVGKVSAMVREELFDLCAKKMKEGGFHMVHNWQCEQGFLIRSGGDTAKKVVDYDGLLLIQEPPKTKRETRKQQEESDYLPF